MNFSEFPITLSDFFLSHYSYTKVVTAPSTFLFVPLVFLYVFYCWYQQPRERAKHLPTAPFSSSSNGWKRTIAGSILRFLGGHLIESCYHGLERCSETWFASMKTRVVCYYHGRQPVVLVGDPDAAKIILRSSNDRSSTDVFYDSPVTLSTAQGAQWKSIRKVIMPKMYKIAKESRPVIYQHAQKLRQVLHDRQHINQLKSIDVVQLMRSVSLDIIAELLLDTKVNTLGGDNTDLLEDANNTSMGQVMANRSFLIQWSASLFRFNAEPFLNLVSRLTSKNTIPKLVNEHIAKSIANNNDQDDKNKNQHESSRTWLDWWTEKFGFTFSRASAYIVLVAALDNTAVAMAALLYHLAKNRQIQEKLRLEIMEHCYSNDDNDDENLENEKTLPVKAATCQYLDWCIKESMRMWSHVSFYGRYTTKDTTIPSGVEGKKDYLIPKGTHCMISTDILHNSPSQWQDSDQFRPERFNPDSKEHKDRHQFAYLPLGYGRDCAGKILVSEQMKTIISILLHDFEFRIDESKMDPKRKNPHYQTGLAKFPIEGIHLTIHPRH